MFQESSSSWPGTVSTAITVVGGILAAFVAYLIDKWKAKKDAVTTTAVPTRHIDNITDTPTRDALLALHEAIMMRQQVVNGYLNAQGIACWESDKHGLCIFASDRLAVIVGLDKSEIYGDGWSANIPEPYKSKVEAEWKSVLAKKIKFRMEYPFNHADGTQIWVSANAQPLLKETREPDGTLSLELKGMTGVLTEIRRGRVEKDD